MDKSNTTDNCQKQKSNTDIVCTWIHVKQIMYWNTNCWFAHSMLRLLTLFS
jgi:hypothetical protein